MELINIDQHGLCYDAKRERGDAIWMLLQHSKTLIQERYGRYGCYTEARVYQLKSDIDGLRRIF